MGADSLKKMDIGIGHQDLQCRSSLLVMKARSNSYLADNGRGQKDMQRRCNSPGFIKSFLIKGKAREQHMKLSSGAHVQPYMLCFPNVVYRLCPRWTSEIYLMDVRNMLSDVSGFLKLWQKRESE